MTSHFTRREDERGDVGTIGAGIYKCLGGANHNSIIKHTHMKHTIDTFHKEIIFPNFFQEMAAQ